MGEWEQVRHQITIAGRVADLQTQQAIAGARVQITQAPAVLVAFLATKAKLVALPNEPAALVTARSTLDDSAASSADKLPAAQSILDWLAAKRTLVISRPDRTASQADGHFGFLDLPDGQYALTVSLPGVGSRYGPAQVQNITVARDGQGKAILAVADLFLPPTTVRGQIQQGSGPDAEPVTLAEVQLGGSGERTWSDGNGQYALLGLEISQNPRTVMVSASGYQSASQTVLLAQAGTVATLNFTLVET